VETTGLFNSDRVVEVAAIALSPRGDIVDEWGTLVNPERDIGPTQSTESPPSKISFAPRFEETAVPLATRIHGSVLVAHNLPSDSRMLANEYSRLGSTLDPGRGVGILSATGMRLEGARVPRHQSERLSPRAGRCARNRPTSQRCQVQTEWLASGPSSGSYSDRQPQNPSAGCNPGPYIRDALPGAACGKFSSPR
jgi:hypothetical protein